MIKNRRQCRFYDSEGKPQCAKVCHCRQCNKKKPYNKCVVAIILTILLVYILAICFVNPFVLAFITVPTVLLIYILSDCIKYDPDFGF